MRTWNNFKEGNLCKLEVIQVNHSCTFKLHNIKFQIISITPEICQNQTVLVTLLKTLEFQGLEIKFSHLNQDT